MENIFSASEAPTSLFSTIVSNNEDDTAMFLSNEADLPTENFLYNQTLNSSRYQSVALKCLLFFFVAHVH